jgi:hypothetical protein
MPAVTRPIHRRRCHQSDWRNKLDRVTLASVNGRECVACGGAVATDARFCRHCGAEQLPPTQQVADAAPAHVADTPTAQDTDVRSGLRADDFAAALTAQIKTPAVMGAVAAGAAAFVLMLIAGFLVAVATTSSSFIGGFDDASLVKEWLIQTCALVGAPLETSGGATFGLDFSFQTMPTLGVAVPIAAMAFAVRRFQVPRVNDARAGQQLLLAIAAVVPFALLMLIPALTGDFTSDGTTLKPAAGAVFGLSLLWGAVGALIAVRSAIGVALSDLGEQGERIRVVARPFGAILRALGVALLAGAVVVSSAVLVQTFSEKNVRADRAVGGAAAENTLYAVEHGVHGLQLGTLTAFELPQIAAFGLDDEDGFGEDGGLNAGVLMPLPAQSARAIVGDDEQDGYRIFDYSDAMQAYTFVPLLILLIAIPVVTALYAGFSAARATDASTQPVAVAWGALTGPVWALTMVLLNAITKGTDLISLFGHADGGSTFGWSLLFGVVFGALGGLLASVSSSRPAEVSAQQPSA